MLRATGSLIGCSWRWKGITAHSSQTQTRRIMILMVVEMLVIATTIMTALKIVMMRFPSMTPSMLIPIMMVLVITQMTMMTATVSSI